MLFSFFEQKTTECPSRETKKNNSPFQRAFSYKEAAYTRLPTLVYIKAQIRFGITINIKLEFCLGVSIQLYLSITESYFFCDINPGLSTFSASF